MTKREALENVLYEIKKLDNYLNETDPKHPINIIDSGYTESVFSNLTEDCDTAAAWINGQIEVELERENDLLPSEGRRTGHLVGE